MATVPGPMVEAVSTVHMRASLSAGGTVTFIPPELQAAIDLSAFDKFLRTCADCTPYWFYMYYGVSVSQ
jgi:hypothetical protein